MSTLTGRTPAATYHGLLQVPGGITTTLTALQDGFGENTALALAAALAKVTGTFRVVSTTTADKFVVEDVDGNTLFSVSGDGTIVGDGLATGSSFIRSVANKATRNAIVNGDRQEGMVVYLQSDQIYYQLLPAPWTGVDAEWAVFSNVNAFAVPTFLSFGISGQGSTVVDGTTISGTVTFTWSTSPAISVAANSIAISDRTASVTLATGLADDGSQSVALPTTVVINTGDTHTWRVTGTDTKTNPFYIDFSVTGVEASDNTFYVRTDGSDANGGLSDNSGGAWLTFQHAADSVGVGDKVNIRSGTFPAGFTLGWDAPQSGAAGHPIWFSGGGVATINHRNSKNFDAIDVEGCSYVKLTGLVVTNDGTVTRSGIRMSAGGFGCEISGNSVTSAGRLGITTGFLSSFAVNGNTVTTTQALGGQGTGHAIYVANTGDTGSISGNVCVNNAGDGIHTNGDVSQGGLGYQSNVTLEKNDLHGNNSLQGGAAINADGLLNSVIRNNLIYNEHSAGIALYAIDASRASTGNVVVNNTVLLATDSAKHCIRLANASAGNVIFNNILYNAASGGMAICADADSIPVSDYNLVTNRFSADGGSTVLTLAQWQAATGQDLHSVVISSPSAIFTNVGTNDYTLLTSGPAINTGVATLGGFAAPADDFLGATRPFATSYDTGCYESHVVSVGISAVSPVNAASGVAISSNVTFTFDRDVDPNSIVFTLVGTSSGSVAGSLTYNSGSFTATFDPTSNMTAADTFTATISAADAVSGGVTLVNPYSWSFSTIGTHRLFGTGYTPATPAGNSDSTDLTLGVYAYTTATGATVTKIAFYKTAGATGTHTAKLWTTDGTLLASKDFSGETSTGWQTVTLDTPVAISANTRYVVSVHFPNGNYAYSSGLNTYSNSPLFTGDVLAGGTHMSGIGNGDTFPSIAADTWYGVDFEILV